MVRLLQSNVVSHTGSGTEAARSLNDTSTPAFRQPELILESTSGTVKLFRSSSRKQRMFEFAMMRTPLWCKVGKEMLKILAKVIEDDQPTPQVSYQVAEDSIWVTCTWLVSGESMDLFVDDSDGVISMLVSTDQNEANHQQYEFETQEELILFLRGRLSGMGKNVKSPLV